MAKENSPILIIDDSTTARTELRKLLEKNGYTVEEAEDGQQALDLLSTRPDIKLAICDIHMPVVSGIEFLEKAVRDKQHPDLMVIMLTTAGKPKLVRAARDAGAKGYIVKPFQPKLMLKTLERALS